MRDFFYALYILLFCFLLSCGSRSGVNQNIQQSTRLDQQKTFLYGKNLKSLRKIMNDSIDIRNHIVFLYNGFDCEACIKKGYKLSKVIDSLAQRQVVYIISTSANIGADQLKCEYPKYVYNDEHDLVRSELKYVYTPVFLFLDSTKSIDEAFYPNYSGDSSDEVLFINNCLEKMGKR